MLIRPAWLAILISLAAGGLGWGLPMVFLALHALVGLIAVAVELPSGKQQPVERSSPCSPPCLAACGSRGREKADSLESARSVCFATSLAQLTRSANLCDRECLVNFRESAMSCVCYHSCRRKMSAVFSGRFSPTGEGAGGKWDLHDPRCSSVFPRAKCWPLLLNPRKCLRRDSLIERNERAYNGFRKSRRRPSNDGTKHTFSSLDIREWMFS